MRVRKALNIILTVLLSGLFLWLGYRHFTGSYIRLGESFKDLFGSLKYYFYMLFDKPVGETPHVAEYSEFVKWEILLPKDFETFKLGAAAYFKALFNGKNFVGWLTSALTDVGGFAKVMMLILPCIVVGIIIIKRIYGQENTNHGRDTVPLRVYKFIAQKTYQPIKGFVQQYIEFGFLGRSCGACTSISARSSLSSSRTTSSFRYLSDGRPCTFSSSSSF